MWGGGGGLSFREADVVPLTFDLDLPEGLSCRESTVDESGGKTVTRREGASPRKSVVQSSCQYDVMSRFGDFSKWRAKSLLMRRIK